MKKRIITAVAFAAGLALCAAVWPKNAPTEETSALPESPAVIATQPEASERPEIKEIIMTEEEKVDVTQPEPIHKSATNPEPTPPQKNISGERSTGSH